MKLTESKKTWVHNRIRKYCKEMEVAPPNLLILTRRGWSEWANYQKELQGRSRYRSSANCYGICHHKAKVMAIFVKAFPNMQRLDQTIRHELTHYVRRFGHHSKRFKEIMAQIKRGTFKA